MDNNNNNKNNDKLKLFSEIFDDLKLTETKNIRDQVFISTDNWLAQLGDRNLT